MSCIRSISFEEATTVFQKIREFDKNSPSEIRIKNQFSSIREDSASGVRTAAIGSLFFTTPDPFILHPDFLSKRIVPLEIEEITKKSAEPTKIYNYLVIIKNSLSIINLPKNMQNSSADFCIIGYLPENKSYFVDTPSKSNFLSLNMSSSTIIRQKDCSPTCPICKTKQSSGFYSGWVVCIECMKWHHQYCIQSTQQFVDPSNFLCQKCLEDEKKEENEDDDFYQTSLLNETINKDDAYCPICEKVFSKGSKNHQIFCSSCQRCYHISCLKKRKGFGPKEGSSWCCRECKKFLIGMGRVRPDDFDQDSFLIQRDADQSMSLDGSAVLEQTNGDDEENKISEISIISISSTNSPSKKNEKNEVEMEEDSDIEFLGEISPIKKPKN